MNIKRDLSRIPLIAATILFTLTVGAVAVPVSLPDGVAVTAGPVNLVTVARNGHRISIYGDADDYPPSPEMCLLTHSRRDVAWAALQRGDSGSAGLEIVAPAAELEQFAGVGEFWKSMAVSGQFHDYAQQTTRILASPLNIDRPEAGGGRLSWQDLEFRIIDTPGYTRGAISYIVRIDGRKIGFTGDLLWGDGRILDLYSLQDAIEGTRIRGYHGYAGRIGRLLASLRKVREERCDLLVPSRGPVIGNPEQAINALIERLQAVYANYLSINAGRWYFKDDYDTLAEKALNPGRQVAWMPWAETINEQPPDWIRVISNSRLIVSQDRSAFLVDCGSEKIFREIRRLQDEGAVTSVDGLFITHYHDDHTDFANQAAKAFDCPVYATEQSADILAHPRAYHLPAMTPNPVENIRVVPDGFEMRWKEFSLRFFYFPGQTIYHDALLLTRDNGETIFFIGDSFSPSGIDDYCLLNRNLLQENTGYFHCLDFLKKLPPETLLINEHITQPFAFNSAQVAMMTETLRERLLLCRELFPWDDPNYGLDEQWIRFEPYSMELQRGSSGKIAIKVFNHSPEARVFKVRINVPDGLRVSPEAGEISVGPRQAGNLSCTVSAAGEEPGDVACPGVLTADVLWEKNELREWCEALVMIGP